MYVLGMLLGPEIYWFEKSEFRKRRAVECACEWKYERLYREWFGGNVGKIVIGHRSYLEKF